MGSTRLRGLVVLLGALLGTACDCGDSSGNGDAGTNGDAGADAAQDAAPCSGDTPPTVTGSVGHIGFPVGSGTAAYMLTFDEPVTLAAGSITITGGATLDVAPALPATSASFLLTATGLVDGTDYQIVLAGGSATNACGNALAGGFTVNVVSGCHGDATSPTVASTLVPIVIGYDGTSVTYQLAFDEMVAMDAGAITVDGGGLVTVTPTLPAVSATFVVEVSGIDDAQSYTLGIAASRVADRCGNVLASDAAVSLVGPCLGHATTPTITSSVADLVLVPGATTLGYDLTFDDDVVLSAGAITADNGATVTVDPPLPATGRSFTVSLSNLTSAQNYTLTIDAAHVADRCGAPLAASASIDALGACVGNVAPTITSQAIPRRFSGSTFTHTLTFDEPVMLGSNAITVDHSATVAVTPALPAMASSFDVVLSNLVGGTTYTVAIADGAIADVCGAQPSASQSFSLVSCGADTTPPNIVSDTSIVFCSPQSSYTYVLQFDELVYLPAGAFSTTGNGAITSITPALPAYGNAFSIVVQSPGASTNVGLVGGLHGDCGGTTPSPATITLADWVPQSQTFSFTGSIVSFQVPVSDCSTTIEAWGAQGGHNDSSVVDSGLGARMRGTFTTLPSRDLRILVGEQPSTNAGNGGGGGTFVVTAANVPLVIAGGGGGSAATTDGAYKHGTTSTSGQSCPPDGGQGGSNGNGGSVGPTGFQSGAGGGLLTSGANGWTTGTGGSSFLLGGSGGTSNGSARGGFGGGGSGSSYVVGGGGGGYSGGGGCGNTTNVAQAGAGGGSYNAAPIQDNASGVRTGHGQVVITW